ncbi:MAG TPA: OmpA family protein [Hellea balneolensis]|uniref:OmpA family protein n=1 Tax=Hellea balneolensis TaxID=287478 RepID=A0A7V5NXY5_9PROT|nr:OmpA family protein [Hellea balneolensis]
MGTFAKWLWGIIILFIIALLINLFAPAPWGAKANSKKMGMAVQNALNESGNGTWARVDMSGNVARIVGEAPSAAAKASAVEAAKNAQCQSCANREAGKRWHVVDDSAIKIAKVIPVAAPYTLTGVFKDGVLVLNGYVSSEAAKAKLLADAKAMYGDKVRDDKIRIARGAPNVDWNAVAHGNMSALSNLDYGRFDMKDMDSLLTGHAASVDKRDAALAALATLPAGFNGASKIEAVGGKVVATGIIKSAEVCQQLFKELKGKSKIKFAYARAEIRDGDSLILLDAMADAAKKCSTYVITVEGHTDADGPAEYNQNLSQKRADTVANYLISKGVNPAQIKAVGYGEAHPIADNTTPEGMAANRRIEFKISESK